MSLPPSKTIPTLAPTPKATKKHIPTEDSRAEVLGYAAVGITQADIALIFGIAVQTLTRHYRQELDVGKAKANVKVGKSLFEMATSGNVTAAIFWMKCQAGWSERSVVAHVGADGGAVALLLQGSDRDG